MSISIINNQPFVSTKRVEPEIKVEKEKKSASESRSDSVDSWKNENPDDANLKSIKTFAKAVPDIREERIAEVKAKISSAFYDTDKLVDSLAEIIIG
jgi:anti-sigma28 factor (negative regulator of flagellin synthesis)